MGRPKNKDGIRARVAGVILKVNFDIPVIGSDSDPDEGS
jgi:hypothetical protein